MRSLILVDWVETRYSSLLLYLNPGALATSIPLHKRMIENAPKETTFVIALQLVKALEPTTVR